MKNGRVGICQSGLTAKSQLHRQSQIPFMNALLEERYYFCYSHFFGGYYFGFKVLDNKDATLHGSLSEPSGSGRRSAEAKLLKRYRTTGIPMPLSRIQNETSPAPPAKPTPTKRGIPVLKSRLKSKGEL